jgi:hypothetical protein
MTAENTPDAATPDTIVLIHGFWMTSRSWEKWVDYYEGKGYRVLAPAYPGLEVEVEALREDPSPIEALSVQTTPWSGPKNMPPPARQPERSVRAIQGVA